MALYKIDSLKDLQKLAKQLAAKLKGGDVVALSGPLGAGKTTLAQMIGRELGIKKHLTSPTFILMKLYNFSSIAQKKSKAKYLCHIDLYRINPTKEMLGFEEYLGNKDYICFVEWAEKIKNKLPKGAIKVSIKLKDSSRLISF